MVSLAQKKSKDGDGKEGSKTKCRPTEGGLVDFVALLRKEI